MYISGSQTNFLFTHYYSIKSFSILLSINHLFILLNNKTFKARKKNVFIKLSFKHLQYNTADH